MPRENQKQRTRMALIHAAAVMAREGRTFSVAEVAEAAKVSTATAYRYFPNPQSLWTELAVLPSRSIDLDELFRDVGNDAAERMDVMVRHVVDMQFEDEAPWRALVRASLERWFERSGGSPEEPVRGDSRMLMTREVLAPLEGSVPPEVLRRLTMALMLVYGVEAMIVTRDACHLERDEAAEVMRWAAQALIQAALKDS